MATFTWDLKSWHHLHIYNGMIKCWRSESLTCFPFGGGGNIRGLVLALWKLKEPRLCTPIEDPFKWLLCAESVLCTTPASFVTAFPPYVPPYVHSMVEGAIRCWQHGRSSDHAYIQSEHLIYIATTCCLLLAYMFNHVLVEGFPSDWTIHTIIPFTFQELGWKQVTTKLLWLVKSWPRFRKQCFGDCTNFLSTCAEEQGSMHQDSWNQVDLLCIILLCVIEVTTLQLNWNDCAATFVDFCKVFGTIRWELLFCSDTCMGGFGRTFR